MALLSSTGISLYFFFFFFNDTATTEIYTLSLHDALPISKARARVRGLAQLIACDTHPLIVPRVRVAGDELDRKSTRLNSSHSQISYAVFCLKKKKESYSLDSYQEHLSYHTYTFNSLRVRR